MAENFYVKTADLNSLYDDKPGLATVVAKVSTKEEAEKLVRENQTHDTAAWYDNWDSEDRLCRWDSADPCLSVSYKYEY